MDEPVPPLGDKQELILWRLDQQDRNASEYRASVKQDLMAYRQETQETSGKMMDQLFRTNGRVGALEKWMWTCLGAILTLYTLIAWFVTWGPSRK